MKHIPQRTEQAPNIEPIDATKLYDAYRLMHALMIQISIGEGKLPVWAKGLMSNASD